ncbi:MAG: glycosyltransferase [Solirubrobacteraceae bacterium]
MILFLHNRYRVAGGEERAVADLQWLMREHLGEEVEELGADSAVLGRSRAAVAMLRGGLAPEDVAAAVRRTGARAVSAHNVLPTFGWRALAAARGAGARVVLHLHNYRLVCAVGTCFSARGEDCVRCQGRDTAPGVALGCRGSRAEGVVYAAGLSLWSGRVAGAADAVVVPSEAAAERLRALRAPVGALEVVPHALRTFAERSSAGAGEHVLVASRLAVEKGVDLAVEACERAGLPLVVAGDGPLRAASGSARFVGRVSAEELASLRARAALALVPSRSAETFGLAAAEAMAAGVPVVASRIGALADLVDPGGLVAPGDAAALAERARARFGDEAAGRAGLERVRSLCAPPAVAERVARVYA